MTTNLLAAVPLPPHGLEGIVATFGDIFAYITEDHSLDLRWQSDFLARAELPFPVTLSWDRTRQVSVVTCHRLLVPVFADVFDKINGSGLQNRITSFGGCFSFRPQRTGSKLSTHAWGVAVDLNPETNEQGTAGNMDPTVISIFCQAGFEWGGTWEGKSRDPMHFQFCTEY